MSKFMTNLRTTALAAAIVAAASFAWDAATPAQAQAPTFQTFGLSTNVKDGSYPEGYSGEVKVTCEANPSQSRATRGPVRSNTSGVSAQLSCKGPYKVEGYIEKDGARVTCTPFQYRDASDTGMNFVQYQSVKQSGSSATCAMAAFR